MSADRLPNKAEREFLWRLRPGELVTRGDIGPAVMGEEARARQHCRKHGWATYEGHGIGWQQAGWVLTKAGDKARRSPTSSAPLHGE